MSSQDLVGSITQNTGLNGKIYPRGPEGNGIEKIELTSSVGLTDTYTIYFTNGTTKTYTITNGEKGDKGEQRSSRYSRRTTEFKVFKVFKDLREKLLVYIKHM